MSPLIRMLPMTLLLSVSLNLWADEVPAVLPDPDGLPGNASKPVKVYLLAGQSNMVGMGDISGARNMYTGMYYSTDSRINEGPLSIYQVGNFKLSRLALFDSAGKPSNTPLPNGVLRVPQKGVYQVQCGSGHRSYNVLKLNGVEVYRRESGSDPVQREIALEAGTDYPYEIVGISGKPPHFWLQKMDLLGSGDLESVAKRDGKFPWLVGDDGEWTVRHDVYFQEARLAKEGKGSLLSATSNGKSIGPELGFGHVLGAFHDEQVLLIKTAQGNRSLGFDFRPPSSGRTDPTNQFESLEYKLMIEGVRKTLDNIENVVPGYQGQGYELAGFAWFQGHKDSFADQSIADYEKHLVNLINDVRREFKRPRLPVVVATVGFGGHNMAEKFERIFDAQMAVGDASQHPEYEGTVATVDTRPFWREIDESPKNQDYHYHRNAETYMLIGDALGRAMVGLQGGHAAKLPQQRHAVSSPSIASTERSESQLAMARTAMAPIIIDGIASSYARDPRRAEQLHREAKGERPPRANQFLRGSMFGLVNCYQAAGNDEYQWKTFGPDLDRESWQYFSFDPPESLSVETPNRYRKITYPVGMENWTAPSFDALDSGWKTGQQPFGQLGGEMLPLSESCNAEFCRCGHVPKTRWEKEVLLMRGTFEFPPLRDGFRYRIVVGGAAHVNSGEGFALYINGKLLAESTRGVAVRQGGQPRGGHIDQGFRDEFRSGKVTIAAKSFLRFNHPRIKPYPARGHLSLRVEEQKIPPLAREH